MLSRSTDTSTATIILVLLSLLLSGVVLMVVEKEGEVDKERRALVSAPSPSKTVRSSPESRSCASRGGFDSFWRYIFCAVAVSSGTTRKRALSSALLMIKLRVGLGVSGSCCRCSITNTGGVQGELTRSSRSSSASSCSSG